MRQALDDEREGRQMDREAEAVRERKRALFEKELATTQAGKDADKEMRRFKERLDQDFEFREAQLEARYQQLAKQLEVDSADEREG